MTEIAARETNGQVEVASEHLTRLGQWAVDAGQAYRVAQSLAETSFVPTSMRKKAGEITAAILTGQEIGLEPMSALRSIDVIQGTPAMRAHALRGLVQSRGHEVWVDESTETRAVVCGRRKGTERVQKSVWTIDKARRMGLTEKDNWKRMPENMLVARATAEVCRLIASDVLLGMPYAVEEIDEEPEAPRRRRTAQRKPTEQAEIAAPDLEDKAEPETGATEDITPEPDLLDER